MPNTVPWPIACTASGVPEMSPPRVRNSPKPRTKIIIDNETRIGCAPVVAMIAPISQPTADPVASAAKIPSAIAKNPASTPPSACSVDAIARPDRLAVNVIARLNPPEMIGISIASVSSPSSGNWKAIEVKVVPLRKF